MKRANKILDYIENFIFGIYIFFGIISVIMFISMILGG